MSQNAQKVEFRKKISHKFGIKRSLYHDKIQTNLRTERNKEEKTCKRNEQGIAGWALKTICWYGSGTADGYM